jgi:hypothetical protein
MTRDWDCTMGCYDRTKGGGYGEWAEACGDGDGDWYGDGEARDRGKEAKTLEMMDEAAERASRDPQRSKQPKQ